MMSRSSPSLDASVAGMVVRYRHLIHVIRNVRKDTPLTGTRTRMLTDAVANSESTRQRLAEADLPGPCQPVVLEPHLSNGVLPEPCSLPALSRLLLYGRGCGSRSKSLFK
jgi:hypothetical protein